MSRLYYSPSESRMFEDALRRPSDYFKLDSGTQWRIDYNLGILDWFGGCSHAEDLKKCKECSERWNSHFNFANK